MQENKMSGTRASYPGFDFSSNNAIPGSNAQPSFTSFFGSDASIGMQSVVDTGAAVPDASASANQTLIIAGGNSTYLSDNNSSDFNFSGFTNPYDALASAAGSIPSTTRVSAASGAPAGHYRAVYDLSDNDTLSAGSGDLTVFLQNSTNLLLGNGSDVVYAGGADTIAAGSGATTVFGGASGATVQGGTGVLQFVGGAGAVSTQGGSGTNLLYGGTGSANSYLVAGSGNSTLIGGSGAGPTTLNGGSGNLNGSSVILAFAAGSGSLVVQGARAGTALINGTTGSGQELILAPTSGVAIVALNNNSDTVVAGGGNTTVVGGSGPDLYGFLPGLGGSEAIFGFKATDRIQLTAPISSETVADGSDMIEVSDGTRITLVGFAHKLFS
jgi:Ca2+-binding RTX toxin-like protein